MPARHLQDGSAAERLARQWLEQRGLECLSVNFRCKAGELDLVMLDDACLVIVEVRYRRSTGYGGPLASVSAAKQRRIIRATRFFLQRHHWLARHPLRFDVLALNGPLATPLVDWRKRAFDAGA